MSTATQRHLHLVAYDVRNPRRLQRVHRQASHYIQSGQKSVHECWLSASEKATLVTELRAEMDESTDLLLVLRLDPRQHTLGFGRALIADDSPLVMVA